jgi:Dolichyl-phosphate-mannose-protein mannosyltransferase
MPAAAISSARTSSVVLPWADRVVIPQAALTTVLILVTVLALGLRATALSTFGFSEDEVNKVRAIDEYRRGHFSANAEHPMLMKLAMWTSVEATRAWNRVAPAGQSIDSETAIRLPNVVAGAALTVALFGLCHTLFGASVAAMASLLWALDVNAIAINRIGKEDTFALLFFVLATWCYERGKRQGNCDPRGAQAWYTASGASFGLMLASKYFPHYLGIYALFNHVTDRNPGANRPNRLWHFGAMALTAVAANFAVLTPATWKYCIEYLNGATLTHHGYAFAGQVYANNLLSANGVPVTFYLRVFATKVPLVVLAATIPGLIEAHRRRHERGFVLLGMWLVLLIVPYSFVAPKFLRYALPMFAALDVLAAIGIVAGIGWVMRKSWLPPFTGVTVAAASLSVCIAGPFLAQHSARPFYSLFRNAVGERLSQAGATFPEEAYDYGIREAAGAIAETAERSAVVVSDAPASVGYYLAANHRVDLQVRSLSADGLPPAGQPAWVIVQREHLTFENRAVIAQLERQLPWRVFYAADALTAKVFRIPRN